MKFHFLRTSVASIMGAPWQKVTHKFAQLFGASAHFARSFAAFQFIYKVWQIFDYAVILRSAPE